MNNLAEHTSIKRNWLRWVWVSLLISHLNKKRTEVHKHLYNATTKTMIQSTVSTFPRGAPCTPHHLLRAIFCARITQGINPPLRSPLLHISFSQHNAGVSCKDNSSLASSGSSAPLLSPQIGYEKKTHLPHLLAASLQRFPNPPRCIVSPPSLNKRFDDPPLIHLTDSVHPIFSPFSPI